MDFKEKIIYLEDKVRKQQDQIIKLNSEMVSLNQIKEILNQKIKTSAEIEKTLDELSKTLVGNKEQIQIEASKVLRNYFDEFSEDYAKQFNILQKSCQQHFEKIIFEGIDSFNKQYNKNLDILYDHVIEAVIVSMVNVSEHFSNNGLSKLPLPKLLNRRYDNEKKRHYVSIEKYKSHFSGRVN